MLTFANACMYNNDFHELFEMAEEVAHEAEKLCETLRSVDATMSVSNTPEQVGPAWPHFRHCQRMLTLGLGWRGWDQAAAPPSASGAGSSASRGGGSRRNVRKSLDTPIAPAKPLVAVTPTAVASPASSGTTGGRAPASGSAPKRR